MGERLRGSVKWFQSQKGFGFIAREDGGSDVFVHVTGVEGSGDGRNLQEGERVEFEIVNGQKGDKAVQVRRL